MLGVLAGLVGASFFTMLMNGIYPLPRFEDEDKHIVKWQDQLYQMVPVEKKIEYVKPEAK